MKMARVPVRRLESRAALAEVNLTRDSGANHPLERSVYCRSADPWIGPAKHRNQIVRAQMTLLAQEGVHDPVAFGGALAPCRTQARDVRTVHTENGELVNRRVGESRHQFTTSPTASFADATLW